MRRFQYHQHEPPERGKDEVLQDNCESGCGEANDVGI
jgi:hypothetical protein